uniref:E3 ubiquitin-protein ligase MBR2-like n=1 Tax=Erigeron canadensis TaxID=72917 RepID=UPI001CB942F1|nr:E3 ubiquitin-protein ligase MBR2-like [Erigeron canadensis]
MRRQRNIFDTFSESVDLNQGPSFNGFDMGEADECNNRLSPSERRMLNNDLSGDNHKSPSFSSWDVGESSSRANVQDQVANNWSSSFGNHDSRYKDRTFELSVPPLNMQHSGSTHTPMDVDLNVEYGGNSSNDGSSSVDMEASASGIPNERGTGSFFSYEVQSSPMVNREPINLESSQRYFEQRSTNSSQRSNQQPPLMQVPGMPRNLLPFPWSGNINSRNGSSSSSGFSRGNRNLVQDPTNWSLSTGRPSINVANASSSSRNDTLRIPNLNATSHDQPRLNDLPSWTLFPSSESDSGGHRAPFCPFPLSPSSSTSEENVEPSASNSQGRRHQPLLRSLEVPDDEWRVFAGEGRHMLVSEMRQILNALRRNENLRAEDYMLFDPFINGVADLHDRHRDMRLDVDNMSYEELLALEERIGDVKTGLTEEVIAKSMKQRKHMFFMAISTQSLEPCCICREEYENGDDIGTLDCGHDFHTCCIKQWLTLKNLCPICKKTALST